MIHHLSLPARQTRHVADVLAELFGGVVTGFGPYPDSWIAWAGDGHGTAIEVYPVGTELYPPDGPGQAAFRRDPTATGATATHATVSLDRTEDDILTIAEREGWRALRLPRGPFDVIEFWIENTVMIELMTPDMAAHYRAAAPRAEVSR
ncbi:MAG: hypothetical protein KDB37_01925 [Ilumatobacter sp.]|nr:hypothetical protein [Ilumatobacter sp.]